MLLANQIGFNFSLLSVGNSLNLNTHILRKAGDLDARTSGERNVELLEELLINSVDLTEVVQILDENSALDNISDAEARSLDNSLHVHEALAGLNLDVVGEGTGGRVHRDLTRGEHEVSALHSLRIGSNGSRGLIGLEDHAHSEFKS